jgi:hypothetical protein
MMKTMMDTTNSRKKEVAGPEGFPDGVEDKLDSVSPSQ